VVCGSKSPAKELSSDHFTPRPHQGVGRGPTRPAQITRPAVTPAAGPPPGTRAAATVSSSRSTTIRAGPSSGRPPAYGVKQEVAGTDHGHIAMPVRMSDAGSSAGSAARRRWSPRGVRRPSAPRAPVRDVRVRAYDGPRRGHGPGPTGRRCLRPCGRRPAETGQHPRPPAARRSPGRRVSRDAAATAPLPARHRRTPGRAVHHRAHARRRTPPARLMISRPVCEGEP
jgi:hypothetical protein